MKNLSNTLKVIGGFIAWLVCLMGSYYAGTYVGEGIGGWLADRD